MTIVVGVVDKKGVWLAADSKGVSGWDQANRRDKKIFIKHGIGYGFTSSYRMGQILQYHSEDIKSDLRKEDAHAYVVSCLVPMWRKILQENGYTQINSNREETGTFLVVVDGKLFAVHSDMQVAERVDGFDAVGCGDSYALGAIYAAPQNMDNYELAKIGVKAACYFSAGCGGRVDTLFVENSCD